MALLAAAKLGDEMARLTWRSGATAAIDLKSRYVEVQGWFNGVPVYRTMLAPTYPPASYALLWPFLGWMSWEAAQWFWAATTVARALGTRVARRSRNRRERGVAAYARRAPAARDEPDWRRGRQWSADLSRAGTSRCRIAADSSWVGDVGRGPGGIGLRDPSR